MITSCLLFKNLYDFCIFIQFINFFFISDDEEGEEEEGEGEEEEGE